MQNSQRLDTRKLFGILKKKINTRTAAEMFLSATAQMMTVAGDEWYDSLFSLLQRHGLTKIQIEDAFENHEHSAIAICGLISLESLAIKNLFEPEVAESLIEELHRAIEKEMGGETIANLFSSMSASATEKISREGQLPNVTITKMILESSGFDDIATVSSIETDEDFFALSQLLMQLIGGWKKMKSQFKIRV